MSAVMDENGDAHTFCDECGKPLTEVNKYGVFCEDFCGQEESKEASKFVESIIQDLLK